MASCKITTRKNAIVDDKYYRHTMQLVNMTMLVKFNTKTITVMCFEQHCIYNLKHNVKENTAVVAMYWDEEASELNYVTAKGTIGKVFDGDSDTVVKQSKVTMTQLATQDVESALATTALMKEGSKFNRLTNVTIISN